MPTLPVKRADFDFIFRRLVKFLGIAHPNSTEGDQIASGSLYTKDLLTKQIIQSDREVCLLIASVEDHPYRNTFFPDAVPPVEVEAGKRIPAYEGVHGGIRIQFYEKVENVQKVVEENGRLAQSFDHLQRTRRKLEKFPHLVTDSAKLLYWVENGKIEIAKKDALALIYLPILNFDGLSANVEGESSVVPSLFTPGSCQNAVLAHSISTLIPVGADADHRRQWSNVWLTAEQMIVGKSLNIPDPEQLQRLAT